MTQKIQLFKSENIKKIELISREVSRKRKGIQKKKLSDTQCESNINTVADELATSENIATYR